MAGHDLELAPYRHLWGLLGEGCPHPGLEDALDSVGRSPVEYVGVEHALLAMGDRGELRDELAIRELDLIPMVLTFGATVEDHLASYRMQLEWARELPHRQITSQSGRDAFSESEAARFFDEAIRIERDLGLLVGHETHRGRILFNPWTTARLLERFQDLRLTCDLSHWVVVCERIPHDAEDALALAISRAIHVHARVGHDQGPQVSDPAAPEYREYVEAHDAWWSAIWRAQEARGMTVSTFTPEYGPPPYLPTLPRTRQPVADLASVCDAAARRYQQCFTSRQL